MPLDLVHDPVGGTEQVVGRAGRIGEGHRADAEAGRWHARRGGGPQLVVQDPEAVGRVLQAGVGKEHGELAADPRYYIRAPQRGGHDLANAVPITSITAVGASPA